MKTKGRNDHSEANQKGPMRLPTLGQSQFLIAFALPVFKENETIPSSQCVLMVALENIIYEHNIENKTQDSQILKPV